MAQGGGAQVSMSTDQALKFRDQAFHCALGTSCHHSLSYQQGSLIAPTEEQHVITQTEHCMLVLLYISLRESHNDSRISLLPLTILTPQFTFILIGY